MGKFKLLSVNNFFYGPCRPDTLGILKQFVICERLSDSILMIKSLLEISPLKFSFPSKNFSWSYFVLIRSIFRDKLLSSSVSKDFSLKFCFNKCYFMFHVTGLWCIRISSYIWIYWASNTFFIIMYYVPIFHIFIKIQQYLQQFQQYYQRFL